MKRINHSTLVLMWANSPLHYRHGVQHARPDTDATRLGRAVHCAILEPEMFADRFAVKPDGMSFSTRDGKAWRSEHEHLTILSHGDGCAIEGMVESVQDHARARELLSLAPCETERRLEWTDEETGALCAGTPDRVIQASRPILLGIKTTRHIEPRRFEAEAYQRGYHLQWAYYHDALVALGHAPPVMVEIAIENVAPYDVVVHVIPDEILDDGRSAYRDALVDVLRCREHDTWPGWCPTERVFQRPRWAETRDDDGLEDCTGVECDE